MYLPMSTQTIVARERCTATGVGAGEKLALPHGLMAHAMTVQMTQVIELIRTARMIACIQPRHGVAREGRERSARSRGSGSSSGGG